MPETPKAVPAAGDDPRASQAVASDAGSLPSVLGGWWGAIDRHAKGLGLNVSAAPSGGGRSSAWRKKCRRFAVGRRKDFEGSIRDAFESLKLCETSSPYWDVYWGEQWLSLGDFTSDRIKPNAIVNSIPGFRASFGDKVAFAKLHEGCLRQQREQREQREASESRAAVSNHTASPPQNGEDASDADSPPLFCGWTKRGFSFEKSGEILDGPVASFRAHAKAIAASTGGDRNEYPQLWILKPQQSYNQMGNRGCAPLCAAPRSPPPRCHPHIHPLRLYPPLLPS